MGEGIIKICGLTDADDTAAAIDAGANFIGLVFVPGSRRLLDAAAAQRLRDVIGNRAQAVGVFMNQAPDKVRAWADILHLDWVQLHGDEDPAAWQSLGRSLIKRICPTQTGHNSRLAIPLLDPGAGSGDIWDWHALGTLGQGALLAGGLNPDNVAEAIAAVRPLGVDVSSGVEVAPGRKSAQRMGDFVQRARLALELAAGEA